MQTVIDKMKEENIPVHSYVAAIQHLGEYHDYPASFFNQQISLLVDNTIPIEDRFLARYSYLYFVQEVIRHFIDSPDDSQHQPSSVWRTAQKQASLFIQKNSWATVEPDDVEKLDAAGNPKKKKGAKQEMAIALYAEHWSKPKKEIIEIFIKEIGMSPAGASTYYYNCKRNYEE